MLSPFPGMDPFIEMFTWGDFHTNLAVELQRQLVGVLPKYVTRVQERIYIETQRPEPRFIPDINVAKADSDQRHAAHRGDRAVLELEPRTYVTPLPDDRFEPYLEIIDRENNQVVTVLEILSPTNKRRGSDGHRQYQEKRQECLRLPLSFVEIDLLRGGERPPTASPLLPTTDYCLMVHRRGNRPFIEVYEWTLHDRLPRFPVPLANDDADFVLDLQKAIDAIYDNNGYGYTLPYSSPLAPPVRAEDAAWINEIVSQAVAKR
jgi:hypothetical protein